MNIRIYRIIFTLALLLLTQPVWSAPSPTLENIRHHIGKDKVRIVLDLNSPVNYTADQPDNLLSIVVGLENTVVKPGISSYVINDSAVTGVKFHTDPVSNKTQILVDCRQPVEYKAFKLASPHRIVIDLIRVQERKLVQEIAPGLRYTHWYKAAAPGPLNIHVLDISPVSGYALEPALIRQNALGVDPLSHVMLRGDILAAINASYFAPNGDIIGLLKIKDEVVSSTNIARTALGITNEGKLIIDQVSYKGEVELAGSRRITLSGVNENRSDNGLVLYNRYYGETTKTNGFGMEYTIIGGKVAAVQNCNSPIPPDGFVLSAHGEMAARLADLKINDPVTVYQTLGPVWDQIPNVLGAGPMLIKQGNVFLTTKLEAFGSDVAGGRAPRTAVAVTKDERILLVVVDGRQALSKGMSLLELALFLRELGAVSALNLDGGGSSEMIIKGRIVNKPSDGKERKIGNAIAVVPSKLAI